MSVQEEDIPSFRNQYAERILFEAGTLGELLRLFSEMVEKSIA